MSTEPDKLKFEDLGGAFILTAPNGKQLYITDSTVFKLWEIAIQREIKITEPVGELDEHVSG